MVKRVITFAAAVILLFGVLFPHAVSASAGDIRIEQIQAELPEIQAYFYLEGEQVDSPALAASLDRKALQLQDVRKLTKEDATHYFFLVDCSTSTTYAQIEAVKASLLDFSKNMGSKDSFTLLSFGTEVTVLLERETSPDAIQKAVTGLAANQAGTLFFDALAKAIDIASDSRYALERKLAFVFSDSVDYNLGGHTKEEIDTLFTATGLPFYALGFNTGSKENLDNFGAVARNSGGIISIVSAENLPQALDDMVLQTQQAYVATFDSGSNIPGAPSQEFTLTAADSGKTATMQAPIRFWKPDTQPPCILSVVQHTSESIQLTFSEPVQGATLPDSFAIHNENNDLLGIAAAAYDEETLTASITFAQPVASGTLTINCPGIADLSQEQNKVAEKMDFQFTGTATSAPSEEGQTPLGAWLFVAFLGAAVLAAIILAVTKKRNAIPSAPLPTTGGPYPTPLQLDTPLPGEPEQQVHFVENKAPLPIIKLQVTSPAGKSKIVEFPIDKTLFVGRSDICEIYFDDTSMSRQHFVIGHEQGQYTLTNLSETGGTLINGVPVAKPRPLKDGDIIKAGQQTLTFYSAPPHGKGP